MRGFLSSHSLVMEMPRISEACCAPVWYAACIPTHPLRYAVPVQSRLQQKQSVEDHSQSNTADVVGGWGETPEQQESNLKAAQGGMTWMDNRLPSGGVASISASLKKTRLDSCWLGPGGAGAMNTIPKVVQRQHVMPPVHLVSTYAMATQGL